MEEKGGVGELTEAGMSLSPTDDPCVRLKVALPLPGKSSCWKLLPVQPGPRLPPRLTSEQRPLISAQSRLCRLPPGAFLPSPGLGRGSCWNHIPSRLRASAWLRRPRRGASRPESGSPFWVASLLPDPRASCSYKLSKLKMLLRVGDKRESWVSP